MVSRASTDPTIKGASNGPAPLAFHNFFSDEFCSLLELREMEIMHFACEQRIRESFQGISIVVWLPSPTDHRVAPAEKRALYAHT